MQRRLIVRPAHADGARDQQREDADGGEQEVDRAAIVREWRQADVDDFAGAETENGVAKRGALGRRVERTDDVGGLLPK